MNNEDAVILLRAAGEPDDENANLPSEERQLRQSPLSQG